MEGRIPNPEDTPTPTPEVEVSPPPPPSTPPSTTTTTAAATSTPATAPASSSSEGNEDGGAGVTPKAPEAAAKKEPECPKYLDLAFAMDCTGSMSSYINQAQQNIRRIVEEIVSKEKADVRLALVQYRDHPPQDRTFVTKTNDFTESVRKMKGWLDGCSAQGGGDGPEAVADGLHQILKLSWRDEATKICVFISDAPPHGLGDSGDGFPNGCPDGLDPMTTTNQLAEKGVMIYMVGCEPSINPYRDFFMALAEITGGQYVPLASAAVLAKVIVGGAQEEISLQQLRQEVNQEVMAELATLGDDDCVMQEDIAATVHLKMKSKGFKTKQLRMDKRELPQASAKAKAYSEYNCMDDVKKDWSSERSHHEPVRGRRSYGTSARFDDECDEDEDEAPEEASSGYGGGLMGSVKSWFGGGASATKSKKKKSAAARPHSESSSSAMGAPAPPPPAAPTSADAYEVAEDDICEAQTHRMVQQSIMFNKVSRSKCKKT